MDAIEMLEEQHRDVEDLFEELALAQTSDKQDVFDEIATQLSVHAAIEEKHFYPAVKARRTEEILLESLEEHATIKRLLAELMQLDPSNELFPTRIRELQAQVEHHVHEEEEDLFPKVRKVIDRKQLLTLAEDMIVTQEKLLDAGDPRTLVRGPSEEAATVR
jgi:hemerythrin superfamily protein